ncbi:acetate--CoA ligase [Rickettsiales bacterium]|nr:acetate--CoA ligase [Rickettsiales bacterium]
MSFKITSEQQYQEQCQLAQDNPNQFWANIANNFTWFQKWDQVQNCDLSKGSIEWFSGAKLNISSNCLDRHLEKKSNDIALIWEANDPKDKNITLTYQELFEKTCQFANLLKDNDVQKGDVVTIYMPMIPEAIFAMLGCARIGAIHSVVFAGFSAESLAGRINDCNSKFLITSDLVKRGDKNINLLNNVKDAIKNTDSIKTSIIYKRSEEQINISGNYIIWQDEIKKYNYNNEAEIMDSEDPLFILYTSGSTGKPKGIFHSLAGYMVYSAYSFQNVFNYQDKDIFFCTADIGWITGHSYLTYGPLLCGASIVMFEGIPTYPNASRFWDIIDKYQVNIFYTAPTAIRSLMQKGDKYVENYDLKSLKTLGTVGEPINKEAWDWYNEKIGKNKCNIVDTWWQTETGGIMISALAGINNSNPTFAGKALPGIFPKILDEDGNEIKDYNKKGNLCFKQPWPSMARGAWGNKKKFLTTYYDRFKGYYLAGDGCFKDKNGQYRITGRIDDVVNISGHRLSTAEIENIVNSHKNITESAVIGIPHNIKGESIVIFAIKNQDYVISEEEINQLICQKIGPIAKSEVIYFVPDLPKTRSGKIMRRILRIIATNNNNFGDISTLINPNIVMELEKIIKLKQKLGNAITST